MVQIGIDHPHAAAYRETLALFKDQIEVVGLVRRAGDTSPPDPGPFEDVPVFDSIDDMLREVKPDAAQVMLRNNEMGAALSLLAKNGVHIWAEKPVARHAADLVELRDLIHANGLTFTSGYQSRFTPMTRHVRSLVDQGLLGPLTFSHMTTTTTSALLRTSRGRNLHIFDPEVSGGGILHWLGCHMIDLVLAMTGARPARVQAMTGVVGEAQVQVEDVAAVSVEFEGGWIASLNYGYLLPASERSPFGDDEPEPAIYGQKGWVRWNNATQEVRSYSQDPQRAASPWERHDLSGANPGGYGRAAYLAMTNFVSAIAGEQTAEYSVEQAMLVLEIIEAAYQSARERRVIDISPDVADAFVRHG